MWISLDEVQKLLDARCQARIAGMKSFEFICRFGVQEQRHNLTLPRMGNKALRQAGHVGKRVYPRHMSRDVVIELDDRRRVSMGKIGRHDRYLVHEHDDGTLVLEPAVILSEAEVRFMANPSLVAQIENNRAHPERRRSRRQRG